MHAIRFLDMDLASMTGQVPGTRRASSAWISRCVFVEPGASLPASPFQTPLPVSGCVWPRLAQRMKPPRAVGYLSVWTDRVLPHQLSPGQV